MDKKLIIIIILVVLVAIAIILISNQKTNNAAGKLAGESCSSDTDCASGACNCVKQMYAICEPVECAIGQIATNCAGIVVQSCGANGWEKVLNGTQTCKDNPNCDLSKPCNSTLKRVLRKDQYGVGPNGQCIASMAQMVLPTVCVPCGNGVCDVNESNCNCPEDCRNTSCVGEGGTSSGEAPIILQCCVGLSMISAFNEDGSRIYDLAYCTKCGDHICKSPENKYNCPEDCNNSASDTILFQKDAGWGPCTSEMKCTSHLELHTSGKLIINGNETRLGSSKMAQIISAIRDSGIMDKECLHQPVMDYGATYVIKLDGKTKTIDFPGCEQELTGIEQLIS